MDCENCRHLTVVGFHDTGPRFSVRGVCQGFSCSFCPFCLLRKRSDATQACFRSALVHREHVRVSDTCNWVCWLVGCLTSQQHAGVSEGLRSSESCTYCHTETEVIDQTFYLTQQQYTGTGPTRPNADPNTPDAWQCSHWSANFTSLV